MQTIEMNRAEASALRQTPGTLPIGESPKPWPPTKGSAEIFESHRPRLYGVAYRMLRGRAEAEDVLQDAYLRWHEAPQSEIQSPIGFLITVTTRLCLDRLRHLKKERDEYVETWLPEAMEEDCAPSPEEQIEIAGEVAAAFFAVLERLGPEERTAFLLREVFDYDYPEVARMVDKSESACRQLIHRARARVRDPQARFAVTPECRQRLLPKFLAAIATCDRDAIMALLAEEIDYVRVRH